jgi:hypothetical protein
MSGDPDVSIERCQQSQPCDYRAVVDGKLVAARHKTSRVWHTFDPTVAIDVDGHNTIKVAVAFNNGLFVTHFDLSMFAPGHA